MSKSNKTEEVALNRYKVISPVVLAMEENVDRAKLAQVKQVSCEQNGVSDRTLRRWVAEYQKHGFEGLKPFAKPQGGSYAVREDILNEAIQLRREVPTRSVATIIEILELEGKVPEGVLKRSTLQDHFMLKGYSSRHMRLYNQGGIAARRFVRQNRNDLWHSDIKYGPVLTINGQKTPIYMVSFLDDATRYVLHAEFYASLTQSIVEDCFRKAVLKEGAPKRVYFDNGKQYRTKWMQRTCAMMNIRLLYAKPYSPESTGKVEKFNQTVDSFLAEIKLKKAKTLDDFNHYFKIWLSECYQSKHHAGLNMSPETAYKSSKEPLRFVEPDQVAKAFLHEETRKVDKSGCISFEGRKYEVGIMYVGCSINITYDPADTRILTVEHAATSTIFEVKELTIGVHAGTRPKLPEHMTPVQANSSRLLDAKEKQYQSRQTDKKRAIQFTGIVGESNV